MLYRIQFFEKRVSAEQWTTVIAEMKKRLKTFILLAHFDHDKLQFFLYSERNPLSLNASLAALQLDPAADVPYPERVGRGLGIVSGDLLNQVHKVATKQSRSRSAEFWVEIRYGFLARLCPFLRRFRIVKPTRHGWRRLMSVVPVSVPHFLAFDLSKSSQFSVDVVKPKLKVSVEHSLPFDSVGSLSLHNQETAFLDLSKIDFHRHSLIVGQSGSGKSEFLRLATEELFHRGVTQKHGIVIIDPHGKIHDHISRHVPCYHLDPSAQQIEFFEGQTSPLAASELTLDLIDSQVAKSGGLDIRGKRVLRFVLFALYATGNMSYENIAHFLNDSDFRMQILEHVQTPVVRDFFETEYAELRNRYYDTAILPVLNIIGEYQLSQSAGSPVSFLDVVRQNRIIVISVPQGRMGSRLTKLYGATIIQQLFLFAQGGFLDCPMTVMIDELPLVYTPAFNQILAESRKFGLGFWAVQQYLSQLPKEGLNSLFANASNYFCFKTNVDDARLLSENLNLEIESYAENKLQRSHSELASGALLDLSRGELISRLMINGSYVPATLLDTNINAWNVLARGGRVSHG